MPDVEEREEVRASLLFDVFLFAVASEFLKGRRDADARLKPSPQILAALGRKIAFAPSVDLAGLANATDGFSGADLQALVYNAHLEVVHDTIAHPTAGSSKSKPNGVSNEDEEPIRYTALGNDSRGRVLSRAEESAFQRRVRPCSSPCLGRLVMGCGDANVTC